LKSKSSVQDITIPRIELEKLGIGLSTHNSKIRFKPHENIDNFDNNDKSKQPLLMKKAGVKVLPKLRLRCKSVLNGQKNFS
jgi:hypothetical protein